MLRQGAGETIPAWLTTRRRAQLGAFHMLPTAQGPGKQVAHGVQLSGHAEGATA